jgi:hypothetical protein
MRTQWQRAAIGLILFGISFGYVEAAVVIYLRTIYEPIRQQIQPGHSAGEVFPLITAVQLRETAPEKLKPAGVEVIREAATMVMLASVALLVTSDRRLWLPAFAVAFGTWDLFFYVFLKLLIGWPASLFTWDILFVIPVPWAAPVLAPVIVSLSIVGGGLAALRKAVRMQPLHWAGLVIGSLLILLSFMWDFRNTTGGGLPNPFAWRLFATGELLGVGAVLHAKISAHGRLPLGQSKQRIIEPAFEAPSDSH